MRILLLLTLLAGCCLGCGGSGAYAEDIDALSRDWDRATMEVTASINQIADSQEAVNETINLMIEAEGLSGEMEEQQIIKENLQAQSENLAAYALKAFEFVNQWQEGAERLDRLKTSVESDSPPNNIESSMKELRNMIDMGLAKAAEWGKVATEAEATVSSARQLIR